MKATPGPVDESVFRLFSAAVAEDNRRRAVRRLATVLPVGPQSARFLVQADQAMVPGRAHLARVLNWFLTR